MSNRFGIRDNASTTRGPFAYHTPMHSQDYDGDGDAQATTHPVPPHRLTARPLPLPQRMRR